MKGSRVFGALLLALWLVIAILELLKPSGIVGHGYGIAGTVMMLVGVILYSARKRVSFIFAGGKLSTKFLRDCCVEIETNFGKP